MSGIDHRTLVAGLPDDLRRRLTTLSDLRGSVGVGLHLGALAVTGTAIASGVPGWWALLLPHGIVLIFLFTLLHETSHLTVFRTRRANVVVGALCGTLVLVPPHWFRYFHLAHHRHTHEPGLDPELETTKPGTPGAWALHVSGLPVWRGQLATLVRNARGRVDYPYLPAPARGRVRVEARLLLCLYGALIAVSAGLGSALLIWLWVVPALLGQPFLRIYLLAEHARCPHVANMLANTRTTFTNRLVRWLAWNMPYHAEHHAYPGVPFHKLPELHAHARAHLQVTELGYARFNRRYLAAMGRRDDAGPTENRSSALYCGTGTGG